MPRWRNWQTRNVEVVVEATPCWFKSSSGHLGFGMFWGGYFGARLFRFQANTFPF